MSDLTTAQQIEEIRRIVAYTLWKISTTVPEDYDVIHHRLIQSHAQRLFSDDMWLAEVDAVFDALLKDGGVDAATWGQS